MQLHQLLTLVTGIKNRNYKEVTEISRLFQKPDLFSGHSRVYTPKNTGDETFPDDSKNPQFNVRDLLERVRKLETEIWDSRAARDYANMEATADVVINDVVVIKDAPVTWLLDMEKQMNDLRKVIELIPVLDSAQVWTEDTNSGIWRSEVTRTHKTKKVDKVVVLLEQTQHQQGKAEIRPEDVTIGYWNQTNFSGALPSTVKKRMLERVNALADAFKLARGQANKVEVKLQDVGKALFDYIFHE
jgi:hypothetical protein